MKQGIVYLSIGLVLGLYIGYKLPRPKQESEVQPDDEQEEVQPDDEPIIFNCPCGRNIRNTNKARTQHHRSQIHQQWLETQ